MKSFLKKHRKRLIIDFVIVAIVALMFIDSSCRIVKSEYELNSPRLPDSFEGYTVVQLSDLHGRVLGADSRRLVEKTAGEAPDLIVITGDLVDEHTGSFEKTESLLAQLGEIAPVYYVSGNHEWWAGSLPELKSVFERTGVTYLQNDYVMIERQNESIALIGAEDPNGPYDMPKPPELVERVETEQGDCFRILLGHRNYWRDKYPSLEVDLLFCGHAHGGIVRLPFVGIGFSVTEQFIFTYLPPFSTYVGPLYL